MPPPKIGGTFSSPLPTSQAEATDEQPNENSFEEPLPAGLGVQPGKSHVSIMGWTGSNTFPAIDDANGDQQQTRRMSAEYVKGLLGDKRIGELAVKLAFDIFTENRVDSDALDAAWHPSRSRTEMGTLTVSYRNVISLGEGFFFKKSATGGVVMTGDLAGEGDQTGWHALTRMGERKIATQYPTTQIAGLAGVEASVWKRQDLGAGISIEAGVGTGADFPVGATGIGNLRGNGQLGLGTPGNLQFDVGVTGSLQWTLGKALSFPKGGGPIDGLVVTPYGQVTWSGHSFSSTVRVDMNALGMRSPLGTLTFSWFF